MKVIIIGATSGIGRALAKTMSMNGYILGITGRRVELLNSLSAELDSESFSAEMDLSDPNKTIQTLQTLVEDMGGVDIIVINSGVGHMDVNLPFEKDLEVMGVNVVGFTAVANFAYRYFDRVQRGHIVAISSVGGLRGGPAVAYNASKAYVIRYLEGLDCLAYKAKNNIVVSDVRPGFVDTAMTEGNEYFWKASAEVAAGHIFEAIIKKRRVAYITPRWRLIAFLVEKLPFKIYRRLMSK